MIYNVLPLVAFPALLDLSPQRLVGLLVFFPLIALCLTVHEFWHAYSADLMGDPTGRMQGRCTLNPFAHLDPLGTLLMLIGPLGWARPVPINPLNFSNARRGMIVSVAAGPLSNLGLAIVAAIILRILVALAPVPPLVEPNYLTWTFAALGTFMYMNIMLFLFNLIPLYPLDGHHLFREMLQGEARERYVETQRFGIFILAGLVLFESRLGFFRQVILDPGMRILHLIAGRRVLTVASAASEALAAFLPYRL